MKNKTARLIISNSVNDANMFYATNILVSDDFGYLEYKGKTIAIVSRLEYDCFLKKSKIDEVIPYSKKFDFQHVLFSFLNKYKIETLLVPKNFKIVWTDFLRKKGYKVEFKDRPFFEKREIKNEEEIKNIIQVQRVNEKALKSALDIIKSSKILPNKELLYKGTILTSEYIRKIIELEFLKQGCKTTITTVSCAAASAIPHEYGNGPLLANQLIVLDLCPCSTENGYCADMTRTIVKGKATDKMRKMYTAVLKAQKLAIEMIKPRVKLGKVEKKVQEYFIKKGFRTKETSKGAEGFFHSIGHGIGLNMHEPPFFRVKDEKTVFKKGNVVAIEPGLYYPEIGGVRIEDLILVTKQGHKNLTSLPKILEI